MKISVIIPTYRRPQALLQAARSLQDQTVTDFEIIVVDNAVAPEVERVVTEFNRTAKVPVHYLPEPLPGAHNARNTGAKVAHGDVLAFIDDDCVVHRNWLAGLHRAYETFDADAAGGKILIRWDREPPSWVIQYEGVLGKLDYGPEREVLKPGQCINGGNFSIRRSRFFEIGGFNPDQVGDHLVGDGDAGVCHKIHRAGWKMVWVPDALVWHCQTVERNATLSDVRRRFANAGIADACAGYKQNPGGVYRLLIRAMQALLQFISYKAVAWGNSLLQNEDVYRRVELRAAYYKAKGIYYLGLTRNPSLLQVVTQDDWINA